jgi:hypothetical protein
MFLSRSVQKRAESSDAVPKSHYTAKERARPQQPQRASSMFAWTSTGPSTEVTKAVSSSTSSSKKSEPPKKEPKAPKEMPKEKEKDKPKKSNTPKKAGKAGKPFVLYTCRIRLNKFRVDVVSEPPPPWLSLVVESLKDLNSEYPLLMDAASAILVVLGSIPAIPAIAAGGAGPLLAGTAAKVLGSMAVSAGTFMSAQRAGVIEHA